METVDITPEFKEAMNIVGVITATSECNTDWVNKVIAIADKYHQDRKDILVRTIKALSMLIELVDLTDYEP